MADREFSKQKKGLVAIDGAMTDTPLPAAIFSGLLFLGCVALTLLVWRVDRDSREQ
jgi:hypothetical protein